MSKPRVPPTSAHCVQAIGAEHNVLLNLNHMVNGGQTIEQLVKLVMAMQAVAVNDKEVYENTLKRLSDYNEGIKENHAAQAVLHVRLVDQMDRDLALHKAWLEEAHRRVVDPPVVD